MAREKRYDSQRRVLRDGEYERAPGKYVYRWREVVSQTGKHKQYVQHAVSANSLDALRKMELQLQADKNDGIKSQQPATLNAYVDKWFTLKKGLKENTRANYKYMYDKFVRKKPLGKCKVQDLKKSELIKFYNDLVEAGALSISTCETLQNIIGPALQLAFDDDVVRRNVSSNALKELKKEARLQKADLRASGQQKPEVLTLAEQLRFLDVIHGTPWEPVFTFAICTGLRVGEIGGLTTDCVDEAAGVIHIKQNLVYFRDLSGKCGMDLHSTKTESGTRDLPITPKIKEMLDLQKEIGWKCTQPVNGVSDFIFCNREGNPHQQGTLNRALKRIVSTANDEVGDKDGVLLPSMHMHMLRKVFACNQIRKGLGIEEVATLLGHSDIQTSHQFYLIAKDLIAKDQDKQLIDELKQRGIL